MEVHENVRDVHRRPQIVTGTSIETSNHTVHFRYINEYCFFCSLLHWFRQYLHDMIMLQLYYFCALRSECITIVRVGTCTICQLAYYVHDTSVVFGFIHPKEVMPYFPRSGLFYFLTLLNLFWLTFLQHVSRLAIQCRINWRSTVTDKSYFAFSNHYSLHPHPPSHKRCHTGEKLIDFSASDNTYMNCKLTQASIVELRIIPSDVNEAQAICPCCQQTFISHRTQKSKFDKLYRSLSDVWLSHNHL